MPLLWWLLLRPVTWLAAFVAVAWVLPPLPIALGDSGPHVAVLVVAVGICAGVLRASEWIVRVDGLGGSVLTLLAVMGMSAATVGFRSPLPVAAGSFARVALFGISVYCFFYLRNGPMRDRRRDTAALVRVLYGAGVVSAVLAVIDFRYQFPAPAGYGAQFIWLSTGVFRRAQGVFYEASTLGYLCVFLLVMTAVALISPSQRGLPGKRVLLAGSVPLLLALLLSFSRASLLNLGASILTLVWLRRRTFSFRWWAVGTVAAGCLSCAVLWEVFPQFGETYWTRLSNTALFLVESPNAVMSGRLDTWAKITGFLVAHPLTAVFGIGYKTLPYSEVFGEPLIADNTYLSMFAEVGVVGLLALLWFQLRSLREAYSASGGLEESRRFLGTWIFCFSVGQAVQMFSADLLTYWRVFPAYLIVLALATYPAARRVAAK